MLIVGLDTGERSNKTFAVWDTQPSEPWNEHCATTVKSYNGPVEAINDIPEGSRVVFESSTCNFDPQKRLDFVSAALARNLDLYPIYAKHTKNRRADHGLKKDDRLDAWVLLQIGKEGIIPRCRFNAYFRRPLSADPLTRLRQLRYDTARPEILEVLPGFRQAVAAITAQPVPAFAVTAGAARQLKTAAKWNTSHYRMLGPIATILGLTLTGPLSWRRVKAKFRERGLARSNAMFHPLHKKPRAERKEIMRAQDAYNRFVMQVLGARRCILAEQSASRDTRAPK